MALDLVPKAVNLTWHAAGCRKQPQMEPFRDAPLLQASPEGGLFYERVACSGGWMQLFSGAAGLPSVNLRVSSWTLSRKFTAQGGPCLRAPEDDSIPREALCPAAPDRRQGLERDEESLGSRQGEGVLPVPTKPRLQPGRDSWD